MSVVPPQSELIQIWQILQILRDPTCPQHQNEMKNLEGYAVNGQFVSSLLHIFSRGQHYESQGLSIDIRQLAGLVLKNYVSPKISSLDITIQACLKSEILNALSDPNIDIRKTSSIVIGAMSKFPLESWIDILGRLVEMCDCSNYSANPNLLDGSLLALRNIFEDSLDKLMDDNTFRPIGLILSKLSLILTSIDEPSILTKAIECFLPFLPFLPDPTIEDLTLSSNPPTSPSKIRAITRAENSKVVMSTMSPFLSSLFRISKSPSPLVRRLVCQAFVQLTLMQLQLLEPHFMLLSGLMVEGLSDPDELTAIEAADYWASICEHLEYGAPLNVQSFLASLLPALLDRMVFTEEQVQRERAAQLQEEEDDDDEEETPVGTVPSFHVKYNFGSTDRKKRREREEDERELSSEQTIRKSCARVFEMLTAPFQDQPHVITSVSLPIITHRLSSPNPWEVESSILALGALSRYQKELSPHLPHIVSSLLLTIQNPSSVPEIRCIACWTLSRYASWMLYSKAGQQPLNLPLALPLVGTPYILSVQILLSSLRDSNSRVQNAGLSALSSIFEAAEPQNVVGVLGPIFECVNDLLSSKGEPVPFSRKARCLIFDLVAIVSEVAGEEFLTDEGLLDLAYPHIHTELLRSSQPSPLLLATLECLRSLVPLLPKTYLQRTVASLYSKCFCILSFLLPLHSSSLSAQRRALEDGGDGEGKDESLECEDFISLCLDVISAVSEAFGPEASNPQCFKEVLSAVPVPQSLAEKAPPNTPASALNMHALTSLLFSCLHDPSPLVRQASFALAGELCRSSPADLVDSLEVAVLLVDMVLQQLRNHLPLHNTLVTNNAVWMLGELCIALGPERARAALHSSSKLPEIVQHLIKLLGPTGGVHAEDQEDQEGGEACEDGDTFILIDNASILIGRLSLVAPSEMGSFAPEFLSHWCSKLHSLRPGSERDQTFAGLAALLHATPALLAPSPGPGVGLFSSPGLWAKSVENFIFACASWEDPPSPSLQASFSPILQHIKNSFQNVPAIWTQSLHNLGSQRAQQLLDHFKLQ